VNQGRLSFLISFSELNQISFRINPINSLKSKEFSGDFKTFSELNPQNFLEKLFS